MGFNKKQRNRTQYFFAFFPTPLGVTIHDRRLNYTGNNNIN